MVRYKITIVYDGTRFKGFQRQAQGVTVQSEIEQALRCLGWTGQSILAAGRTDAGVHASGQVVTFDLEWKHSLEALGRAINANLEQDIAVCKVERVADSFHPRYDALSRSYRYRLYLDTVRNPLLDRYAWRIDPEIQFEEVRKAVSLLPGTYDCSAFGSPHYTGGSTIRTIFKACWQINENELFFEITANAYLYHMIRRLVFLQVLIGRGRMSLKQFELGVIQAKAQPPGLAPPNGLFLVDVSY